MHERLHRSWPRSAVRAWVHIATHTLLVIADGRILADASRRGDRLAATLLSEGDGTETGILFLQLGVMILDPHIDVVTQRTF